MTIDAKKIDRNGNVVRMAIFGVILLVVIIAAVWEFAITLPGHQNAMNQLESIAKANMAEPHSRADVVKVLSANPATTDFKKFDLGGSDGESMVRHQRVDRYKWSRIIPGKKKLELVVTYECLVKGDEVKGFDPESCEDAEWTFKFFYEPGNAPANVTVQGGKRRTMEETIFMTIDEDVDKFISGTEIIEDSTIAKNMELFDTDGDKKVSLEEFKAAVKKLEEKKGGKLTENEWYDFVGGKSPGEGLADGAGADKGGKSKGGKGKGAFKGKGKQGQRPDGDTADKSTGEKK